MQILVSEIGNTLKDLDNPTLTEDRIMMLTIILYVIRDSELLELEKKQIIEAAKNFANSAEEAEEYYKITYGN